MKQPYIVELDADSLANNTQPALIILTIKRQDIEAGYLSSVLERLCILSDNRQNLNLYKESFTFGVDGYDDDPREVYEIPEIRTFFARLVKEWPHWMWYMCRGVGAIGLLMTLLCEVESVSEKNGGKFIRLKNARATAEMVYKLFEKSLILLTAYGVPERDALDSFDSTLSELNL